MYTKTIHANSHFTQTDEITAIDVAAAAAAAAAQGQNAKKIPRRQN